MDDGSWQLLLIFFILMLLASFFASAESAFSSANKIRIKTRAEEGDRRAKHALYVLNHEDRALIAVLIGNNVAHIAAASVATLLATRLYSAGRTGTLSKDSVTLLCTLITTAVVFLCSEMIPKTLATDKSEKIALFTAPILRFFMKCISPLIFLFNAVTSLITRWVTPAAMPTATEDELYDIVDTIEEEGVMDEEQSDLFKSALDFSNTTAADIMTMARDMVVIDEATSPEGIADIIRRTTHSRIPVFRGDIHHIIGILSIRSFMRDYLSDPLADPHDSMTEPYFVSRTVPIDDLLTGMRQKSCYLAVITDELGQTVGLLTIEDLLEELVGEIWDEEDAPDARFTNLGGDRFSVDTHMMMGDVLSRMGLPCPDPRVTARPVLSWLMETLGKLPDEDSVVFYGSLEVTVDEIKDGRVRRVIFRNTAPDAEAPHESEVARL